MLFISVIVSTILVLMTTFAYKNLHTIGKHCLVCRLIAMEDVYNVDEIGLLARHSRRKSLWVQNSEGPSHYCSCCKHDIH